VIDLSKGRRVAGGSINEAYRVPLEDGRTAFVKTRRDAPPGEYAAEAAALAWLAEPGTVRVPEVIEVDETYLALEWVEPGSLDRDGEEELGRVRLVDVAAAGAPQRLHAAAGRTRDGGLEAHTRSAARSSSSSPRQAASTMSRTVSKPRSPP